MAASSRDGAVARAACVPGMAHHYVLPPSDVATGGMSAGACSHCGHERTFMTAFVYDMGGDGPLRQPRTPRHRGWAAVDSPPLAED